ncbi:MAG: 30S ribosomal protein S6 [Candidatus Scalindua sp.]
MRLYEGMFIISDTIASADWEGVVNHIHDLLKNRGAEILDSQKWDERKFAYKLKGHKRGTYLLTYFNAPEDSIVHIKRDLQLSDNVLRSLIVKTDKIGESKSEDTEKPEEEPVNTESKNTSPAPVASE